MKFLSFALILLSLIACNSSEKANETPSKTETAVEKGAQLFKINCSQCHMPAKDFAAPSLAGVEKRWKDKNLLYDFVRNSPEVIKKDKYAEELFKKWKQAPMLPQPHLTNEEIDAIFAYCNSVK